MAGREARDLVDAHRVVPHDERLLAELEPSRRGVYCGSIGYWSVTGELDTNIAIRTAVARNGRVYFNAGGGIVADSDPADEYQETLDKARGLIDALAVPPQSSPRYVR